MMFRCKICGNVSKIPTLKCKHCFQDVCVNCYDKVHGLCIDCESIAYNKYYKEKIERYEIEGANLC